MYITSFERHGRRRGRKEGFKEGSIRGFKKGLMDGVIEEVKRGNQEGLESGRLEMFRECLERTIDLRFEGELYGMYRDQVAELSDPEILKSLCSEAVEAESEEEVKEKLAQILADHVEVLPPVH